MMQWHPIFAKLLRPILAEHYDVVTNLPVGDAPRAADIVLIRRRRTAASFQGIWRWLTGWNTVEFKGPTVTARVQDLDLLFELGLGIHRRLQSKDNKGEAARIPRSEFSFWYLANRLGRRFLNEADVLFGPLEILDNGIWRARLLGRTLFVVATSKLTIDGDSIPLHLLVRESEARPRELARVMATQPVLFAHYAAWLSVFFPTLREEIQEMAKKMGLAPVLDLRPLVEDLGMEEVINQIGLKAVIDEVGVKRVIDEVGVKRVIDEVGAAAFLGGLSDRQKREFRRLLDES